MLLYHFGYFRFFHYFDRKIIITLNDIVELQSSLKICEKIVVFP